MATTPYPFVSGTVLTASQLNSTFNIPTTTKTASHTLVAADAGTRVIMNSASATTITVNTSIFAASDVVEIQNIGAGICTITAGTATVSTTGSLALAQNGSGRLVFTAAGTSIFQADGVATTTPTIAIFNETQSSGTNGGTFTSGSYVKRTLNTTVVNTITSCTLTSSVISLPAGTYQVFATAPATAIDSHQIRLRNTTDSTDIQFGSTSYNLNSANYAQTDSNIQTVFTLAATKDIELQHRCSVTKSLIGLGAACIFGNSEIYSQITITKIA